MDVLNAALTVSYPVHRAYPFGRWFHRVSALMLAAAGVFVVVWSVAVSAYEPVPVTSATFEPPPAGGWYAALLGPPRPCQPVILAPGDTLRTTNAVFAWLPTSPAAYAGERLNCSVEGMTIAVAGPSVVSELVATCSGAFATTLTASHASNGANSSTGAVFASLGLLAPPRTAVVGALDAVAADLGARLRAISDAPGFPRLAASVTLAANAFAVLTAQLGENTTATALPDSLRTPVANYIAVLSTAAAYDLGLESNTSVATADGFGALSPLAGAESLAAAPKPLPQPPGATWATRYQCTGYARKPLGAAVASSLATAGALWLALLAAFHTLTRLATRATSQRTNLDLSFGPDGSDKYGVSDMATNGTNPSARRTSIDTVTYAYEPVRARDVDELARYMRMGEYCERGERGARGERSERGSRRK
ncbi:hypothetical protein Q8F55_000092 [Vanrija albida]|uniref:Uncharacterized protein n=1 Tax=Vanrija albida TaxID=181172 RepID=A0ABR3QCC0_9TREE